jgi:hypothetical protein
MGSDGVPRRSCDPRFLATGQGGWCVTVYTGTTCLDVTDTATGRSDPGRRSNPGDGRSYTGGRSNTGCYRLVADGHGDTVSRPARTTGGQGT